MEDSCIGIRKVETDELVDLAIAMLKDPKADLEFRIRPHIFKDDAYVQPLMLDQNSTLLDHAGLINYFGSKRIGYHANVGERVDEIASGVHVEEISAWKRFDGFGMSRNSVADEIGVSLLRRTEGLSSGNRWTYAAKLMVMSRFYDQKEHPAPLFEMHESHHMAPKSRVLLPAFMEVRTSLRKQYETELKRQLKDVQAELEGRYRE